MFYVEFSGKNQRKKTDSTPTLKRSEKCSEDLPVLEIRTWSWCKTNQIGGYPIFDDNFPVESRHYFGGPQGDDIPALYIQVSDAGEN